MNLLKRKFIGRLQLFIRQAVGKEICDTVHVTLEKDTKERKYIVPPHIEKALKESGVLDQYLKQPNYLKREQVNFIEVAKKEETKQNRLNNPNICYRTVYN